ncbi:peptidoglycan-binding domain-containing protein [Myxococcus virescens]|uniref:peptidoglycan-binding domain-containing protein n=1 Tax=Myxococcus virescens TaxID=83456 RepID=UPI003DA3F36D
MSARENFSRLQAQTQSFPDRPVDSAVEPCPLQQKVRIRLVVRNHDFGVYTHKKYRLTIDSVSVDGNTGDRGMVDQLVPKEARKAALKVWLTEGRPPRTWNLELGKLKPPSTVQGVQARLSNLGFEQGPVDGDAGAETRQALMAFQADFGLEPSGELDDGTRSRIDAVYRSRQEAPSLEGIWRPKPGKRFKRSKDRTANPPVPGVRDK